MERKSRQHKTMRASSQYQLFVDFSISSFNGHRFVVVLKSRINTRLTVGSVYLIPDLGASFDQRHHDLVEHEGIFINVSPMIQS
jgi:hypothetical protein